MKGGEEKAARPGAMAPEETQGKSVLWVGFLLHIPDVVLKTLETQKQQQKLTKKAATNDCSL